MQYSPNSASWSSSGEDTRSDAPELVALSRFLLGDGIAIVKAITTDEPSVPVSEGTLDPGCSGMSSSSRACGSGRGGGGGLVDRKCCLKADILAITEDERGEFWGCGSMAFGRGGSSTGQNSVAQKG
jgi:hypothetical protein